MIHARSYAIISLRQIADNYRTICKAVDGAPVMGVVKAEAYGHGMLEVARTLETCGAQWLAVSSVQEGIALRDGGIRAAVLVMGGVLSYEWDDLLAHELTPVIHALDELPRLEAAAVRRDRSAPFHLKIDSGMGRLGTRASASEILEALAPLRASRMDGLMTHFASPADFNSAQTDRQLSVFEVIRAQLSGAGVDPPHLHLSSSHAIAYARPQLRHAIVRPGLSLYGYLSLAWGDAPAPGFAVQPALTWRARIVAVKDVPAGAPVGYGALFTSPRPMRIAVLAAGYADGVQHALSNRGHVIAKGRLARILGAVSMDLTTIDVTDVPELRPGDDVTLLGREGDVSLDAQQVADTAGTIPYNILCAIKPRVLRVYE